GDLADVEGPLPKSGQLGFFFATGLEGFNEAPVFQGRVLFAAEPGAETEPPAEIRPRASEGVQGPARE
ncbi:MAG: hypothetical protein AAFY59_12765, partial [Pseudomonadota bacterium]